MEGDCDPFHGSRFIQGNIHRQSVLDFLFAVKKYFCDLFYLCGRKLVTCQQHSLDSQRSGLFFLTFISSGRDEILGIKIIGTGQFAPCLFIQADETDTALLCQFTDDRGFHTGCAEECIDRAVLQLLSCICIVKIYFRHHVVCKTAG